MEEVITIPVIHYEKLKQDNAIMKRDMRIIQKELTRIYRLDPNNQREIGTLLQLIRLLKQR